MLRARRPTRSATGSWRLALDRIIRFFRSNETNSTIIISSPWPSFNGRWTSAPAAHLFMWICRSETARMSFILIIFQQNWVGQTPSLLSYWEHVRFQYSSRSFDSLMTIAFSRRIPKQMHQLFHRFVCNTKSTSISSIANDQQQQFSRQTSSWVKITQPGKSELRIYDKNHSLMNWTRSSEN